MTGNGPADVDPVGTGVFLTKAVRSFTSTTTYPAGTTGVIVAPLSENGFYRVRLTGAEGWDRATGVSVHPSKVAPLTTEMIATVARSVDPERSVFVSHRRIRRLFR